MKVNVQNIEDFFKNDLEVKKIMSSLDIPFDCDYKEEYVTRYADKLYNGLQELKYYFIKTINDLKMGEEYSNHINQIFDEYNKRLIECGINFDKLTSFFTNNIGGMRESFVEDVNSNCFGYACNKGCGLFFKATTINELLHYLHHSIVNNEEYYQCMTKLSKKNNDKSYPITLYGKESDIAQNIFDNFPLTLDVGYTDILSLNNKILFMVRDRGHALTIEINVRENECDVSYYIPKICHTMMVNNLRGVRPVNEDSKFTMGEFRVSKEELNNAIFDFISKVPTDNDMFIEGGRYFEIQKNR